MQNTVALINDSNANRFLYYKMNPLLMIFNDIHKAPSGC